MTTEDNDNQPPAADDGVGPQNGPVCGAECDCKKPSSTIATKFKVAICLMVAIAIGGILFFKTTSARQNVAGVGVALPSIGELNVMAANLDTVFVIIPNPENAPITKGTNAALAAVEQTLKAKGINSGRFTLQTTSPDYSNLAAGMSTPGVVVLTKGRGIGKVSGEISDATLMQAYVASTRSGGCSSGGCPPPKKGEAAAPCN